MIHLQDSTAAQSDTTSNALAPFEMGKLYEPDPVRFSFETIGWPILGSLILIGLLIASYFWYRHYQRNLYRREALKTLEAITKPEQALEIFVVLKRTAIHAFGREKVGGLAGRDWLQFLEKTGKNVTLANQERQIQTAIYQAEPISSDAQRQILSNAKQWIRTHAGKL
jgi:hypothetical protein